MLSCFLLIMNKNYYFNRNCVAFILEICLLSTPIWAIVLRKCQYTIYFFKVINSTASETNENTMLFYGSHKWNQNWRTTNWCQKNTFPIPRAEAVEKRKKLKTSPQTSILLTTTLQEENILLGNVFSLFSGISQHFPSPFPPLG